MRERGCGRENTRKAKRRETRVCTGYRTTRWERGRERERGEFLSLSRSSGSVIRVAWFSLLLQRKSRECQRRAEKIVSTLLSKLIDNKVLSLNINLMENFVKNTASWCRKKLQWGNFGGYCVVNITSQIS